MAISILGLASKLKKGKTIELEEMTSAKFKELITNKFTGKIAGKLKNGDKIVMEYADGALIKSSRSGSVNFKKNL